MNPRIHPVRTHPVNVFVVTDPDDRILSVAVCSANFNRFLVDRTYRRITEQTIPADRGIELKTRPKQPLRFGDYDPIEYFRSSEGITHRVSQFEVRQPNSR